MAKIFIYIALICIVAFAHGGKGGRGDSGERFGGGGRGPNRRNWVALICANSTTAQSYLTGTRAVITALQNNGSYTQFLADQTNTIAYLTNTENDATLASNCTGYFAGLEAARAADRTVLDARRRLVENAARLFMQVVQGLVGTGANLNGYY